MEDMLVRKIRGGLMGMRQGTKAPVEVWKSISRLKDLNPPLGDDYESEYIEFMKSKEK